MVKKMNKMEFINTLSERLSYPIEKCIIINDVLESNFFISKKSKDTIIKELVKRLDINSLEAEKIYDEAILIIKDEIKSKLKHPFKSID